MTNDDKLLAGFEFEVRMSIEMSVCVWGCGCLLLLGVLGGGGLWLWGCGVIFKENSFDKLKSH